MFIENLKSCVEEADTKDEVKACVYELQEQDSCLHVKRDPILGDKFEVISCSEDVEMAISVDEIFKGDHTFLENLEIDPSLVDLA